MYKSNLIVSNYAEFTLVIGENVVLHLFHGLSESLCNWLARIISICDLVTQIK